MDNIQKLKDILTKKKLDAAVLLDIDSSEPNYVYYTGMHSDYSFLIVPKKGNPQLFIPELEYEAAQKTAEIKPKKLKKPISELLKKIVKQHRLKTIALNYANIRLRTFLALKKVLKGIKFKDISDDLSSIRTIKSSDEIAKVQKACSIVDKILFDISKDFSFKTELDLHHYILDRLRHYGAEASFPPIVASGKNSSMPHHKSSGDKIGKGFLLLDFGAKVDGYCSDITRTFYIGTPAKGELAHYTLLNACQEEALRGSVEDRSIGELSAQAKKSLGEVGKFFIHSLGHGIGIEVHEQPSISIKSKQALKRGMVFTIEPGIYFPGKYGIRIEDTVVIDSTARLQLLTKFSKELITIEL